MWQWVARGNIQQVSTFPRRMLSLATHCHIHYHLHPFHLVSFKFKDLVAKQHFIHAYLYNAQYITRQTMAEVIVIFPIPTCYLGSTTTEDNNLRCCLGSRLVSNYT